ncbi:MAG: aminoacetone oxidase family FAD-binding enzyme [Eubacteriales bacterium]|nr:aminoacetone oxidase family FAD-binding enzyme [Eubacteriales bacterium]
MANNRKIFKLIIIGAGPSGMGTALSASTHGLQASDILLLETNPRPGAKLLLTGNGRCNLTQDLEIEDLARHYYGQEKFVSPALRALPPQALCNFFKEAGLELTHEGNKVYPRSNRALDVLLCLEEQLRQAKINLKCREEVTQVKWDQVGNTTPSPHFIVKTKSGKIFSGENLVVASGGRSYPKTGSKGFAYQLALELGLKLQTTGPAMAPLYINYSQVRGQDLAGLSLSSVTGSLVSLNRPHLSMSDLSSKTPRKKYSPVISGDLLFTHKGLSGPLALDLSRYAAREPKLPLAIQISFINSDLEVLENWQAKSLDKQFKNLLTELLPQRLVKFFTDENLLSKRSQHLLKQKAKYLHKVDWQYFCEDINKQLWPLQHLASYQEAMATTGGIALNQVKAHDFSVKQLPQLHFVGECLDIDGQCGGFNLQFAFASGYLAGKAIARQYKH